LVCQAILQYYPNIANIGNTDILLVRIGQDFIGASTVPAHARSARTNGPRSDL